MRLNNLKRYFPDELFNGGGIQYFIDTDGKDWFKSLPEFKKNHSVAFDENGVIRFFGEDPSRFYPAGLSVVDIDSLPEDIDVLGRWVFEDNTITPRIPTAEELITEAEMQKQQLLAVAGNVIAPLQDAVELEIATDAEIALLAEWKTYRVLLNRAKLDEAWPPKPKRFLIR